MGRVKKVRKMIAEAEASPTHRVLGLSFVEGRKVKTTKRIAAEFEAALNSLTEEGRHLQFFPLHEGGPPGILVVGSLPILPAHVKKLIEQQVAAQAEEAAEPESKFDQILNHLMGRIASRLTDKMDEAKVIVEEVRLFFQQAASAHDTNELHARLLHAAAQHDKDQCRSGAKCDTSRLYRKVAEAVKKEGMQGLS